MGKQEGHNELLRRMGIQKRKQDGGETSSSSNFRNEGDELIQSFTESPETMLSAVKGLIEKQLRKMPPMQKSSCIYRIPPSLVKEKPEAYVPHLVSIGPFHRNHPNSQFMESRKTWYLEDFLSLNPEKELGDYIKAMIDLEVTARGSYQEAEKGKLEIDVKSYVMMLVVDGCFILQLLRSKDKEIMSAKKWGFLVSLDLLLLENQLPFCVLEKLYEVFQGHSDLDKPPPISQPLDSSVVSIHETPSPANERNSFIHPPQTRLGEVRRRILQHLFWRCRQTDASLQDPADVGRARQILQHLFWRCRQTDASLQDPTDVAREAREARRLTIDGLIGDSYVARILELLVGKDVYSYSTRITNMSTEYRRPYHLLDFLRLILIPWSSSRPAPDTRQQNLGFGDKTGDSPEQDNYVARIRCATDLQRANVKLVKNKNPKNLLEIKFDDANGVLTIPGLRIDCGTERIIRNLIAYEQYTDDYSSITEYAAFLDGLIDSSKDVELLQKSGIIEIILGDPKDVSRLFNNLLKDVAVHFYYTVKVRSQVEQFCKKNRNEWMATLKLDYFNSPWAFISVIAAIILLTMTVVQTVYTSLSYYHS